MMSVLSLSTDEYGFDECRFPLEVVEDDGEEGSQTLLEATATTANSECHSRRARGPLLCELGVAQNGVETLSSSDFFGAGLCVGWLCAFASASASKRDCMQQRHLFSVFLARIAWVRPRVSSVDLPICFD